MGFAQSAFAQFIVSSAGRLLRIVVGVAIIGWGYALSGQTIGMVLMAVGFVPLLAGAFDLCLLGPLLGAPLRGQDIRQARLK